MREKKKREMFLSRETVEQELTEENQSEKTEKISFENACSLIRKSMDARWRATGDNEKRQQLEREKRAIMGEPDAIDLFKSEIKRIIRELEIGEVAFPLWYKSLEDGIFAELYGLSGLTPWVYDETEEYARSSSAKLIGERLYCLIDGVSALQPQRMSKDRREQLKRAVLMATPRERLETGFHEVYLHNGIRLSIFSGERTKENQDVMVFRKYILKEFTLEKISSMGTFPVEAVPLFKSMVSLGFNVLFAGPVRSGKTSFLQAWQKCEDPSLEGLAISTDPEIPWHIVMPEAPIMQIVADGEALESISKPILRGDNDYILLEEMRDAVAYNIALEITSLGTRRSKGTIHTEDAAMLPYKMATAIRNRYGGDLKGIMQQIFKNINYVFEFCQLPHDRSKKKLVSISEYSYDDDLDRVSIHSICKYDSKNDSWQWNYHIDERKVANNPNRREVEKMKTILENLKVTSPMVRNSVSHPRYYSGNSRGGMAENG